MYDYKNEQTVVFSVGREQKDSNREILSEVYSVLSEKGYDPIGQIIGYLVTEEPAYITNYKGARGLIQRLDRDELLESMLREYLKL